MPIYYHISLGDKFNVSKDFSKNLKNGKTLYYAKKNSFWYNFWKKVGEDVKSYAIYKITIPEKLFTSSFHPKDEKIVRITNKNIKKYFEFENEVSKLSKLRDIKMMRKNNIIGVDLNTQDVYDYAKKHKHTLGKTACEGWLYKFDDIKCVKVGIYKNGLFKKL
jgi:hypothetical protein